MNSHEFDECAKLEDYAFDVMPAEDRLSFERHLDSCESCRIRLSELKDTWNELAYLAEEAEPPVELKGRVMTAIFGQPAVVKHSRWLNWSSAAVIVAIVAGTLFNFQMLQERREIGEIALPSLMGTANIEKLVSLESLIAEPDESYGVACILNKGQQSELVVYLFGAKSNEGTDAYQVWMVQDGQRKNAGTLRVGKQGVGVLTYAIDGTATFDSIGVTLEPDSNGDEPRGPKVYVSKDQVGWNS